MTIELDPMTRGDLERACVYRFLSVLFLPPTAENRDELRFLAGALPPPLRAEAEALVERIDDDLEHAYHALLGGSGRCPDCESDYADNALAGKGPVLADVAAFYQAFRFGAAEVLRLTPDHVAVELDFLGYLALKVAYARHAGLAEEREVCEIAAGRFSDAHLAAWSPRFLERLAAQAEGGFYREAAELTARVLTPTSG